MRKAFKYRLYPTKAQIKSLSEQLSEACRLYNAALQERRDAWNMKREVVNFYSQAKQLKEIRANGDCDIPNFQVCKEVLRRVDRTFGAFYSRLKRGALLGYPRFKSINSFKSLTFSVYGNGCKLIGSKLRLQGVGLVKIKLHRPVRGLIKTITIKCEAERWYVCFSTECELSPFPVSKESVGLDVGLSHFATLSDGTNIRNPRYYQNAQRKLRIAHRRVARRKNNSRRRWKATQLLQRMHAHVRNQRCNFHHKVSSQLVSRFGLIVVEDLNVKCMLGGVLSKSISDAGWSTFLDKIAYKAESAGRSFFRVNPSQTTQMCSGCGSLVIKTLSERVHSCSCGLVLDRDHNAAINILRLGLSLKDVTCPDRESVSLEAIYSLDGVVTKLGSSWLDRLP